LPSEWVESQFENAEGARNLPLTAVQAGQAAQLIWHHCDQFDRMLVAQAARRI